MKIEEIKFSAEHSAREYLLSRLRDEFSDNLTPNGLLPVEEAVESADGNEEKEIVMMSLDAIANRQLKDIIFEAFEISRDSMDYQNQPETKDVAEDFFQYENPIQELFAQIILHYYGYGEDGIVYQAYGPNIHIKDFSKGFNDLLEKDENYFLGNVSPDCGAKFNKRHPISLTEQDLQETPDLVIKYIEKNISGSDVAEGALSSEEEYQNIRLSTHSKSNVLSILLEPVAAYALYGDQMRSEPEFVKSITDQYELITSDDYPLLGDVVDQTVKDMVIKCYKLAIPVITKKQYNSTLPSSQHVPF